MRILVLVATVLVPLSALAQQGSQTLPLSNTPLQARRQGGVLVAQQERPRYITDYQGTQVPVDENGAIIGSNGERPITRITRTYFTNTNVPLLPNGEKAAPRTTPGYNPVAAQQLAPNASGSLGPYQPNTYGPGIDSDATGRPFVWQPLPGYGPRDPLASVTPNVFGPGIGMDQYGRLVQPACPPYQQSC